MGKKIPGKNILLLAVLVLGIILIYYTVRVMKARIDTPEIVDQALRSKQVTLEVSDLSKWQIHALLAVEDPAFCRHNGMDLLTPGAGLTTITQSLVKIFYFQHFKPGIAKLEQSLIAVYALSPLVSKERQLKLFINYIYLGNVNGKVVTGFDQAAKAYYHKPVSRLSQDEYLSIVAMIIAPANFSITKRPGANAERTRRIKKVVSGEYRPKSLMDIYYGKLDAGTRKGLAPASYFPSIYKNK